MLQKQSLDVFVLYCRISITASSMKYCVAFGCSNTPECKGISFFTFPKEVPRRNEWLRRISRKDFNPTNTATLCSAHFTPASYYVYAAGRRHLYPHVLPTIFSHKVYPIDRMPPSKKPKSVSACHYLFTFTALPCCFSDASVLHYVHNLRFINLLLLQITAGT